MIGAVVFSGQPAGAQPVPVGGEGDPVVGELTLKLEKFVGKKLSANEWYYEVKNAYDESLIKLGKEAASSIKRTYLIEAIAMGIIWPIPSKI